MSAHKMARTAQPWHLTRNVILLLVVVLAVAFGLVVLQRRSNPAPLLLFNILADVCIGIFMGLGSRLVFRRRMWLIKGLVSAALTIVGLAFLGAITDSRSGIGPLRMDWVHVDWLSRFGYGLQLPALPAQNETDQADAAHMLIAVDVSWIALRAWGRPGRGRRAPRTDSGRPPVLAATSPAPIVHSVPAATPVVHTLAGPASQPRAASRSRSRPLVRPIRPRQPAVGRNGGRRHGIAGGRRRGFLRQRPAVQLAAYEEHRCPYCLEDVRRNDVRGSVECPICHTLHHKDCWDITGTCQVPHLNG